MVRSGQSSRLGSRCRVVHRLPCPTDLSTVAGRRQAFRGTTASVEVVEVVDAVDPDPRRGVRRRDADRIGLPLAHLRRTAWERVSHGLYVPTSASRDVEEMAAACAQVLPRESGFGHLTSAELRGWWLPNRVPPVHPGLMMASTRSQVHVQRHGMYVRRSEYATVEMVDGLPLMTAGETLVELARDLVLVDLVPLVDCALATGASTDGILAACRPRTRGAAALRRAVGLADPRSESWWESVLRLMHVLAGLGPVESQVEVTDPAGVFVARADLHLVGTNRYPECDGGEHRTVTRHLRDLGRDKSMSRSGLERFGYTTREISSQPGMIIRDAEDARALPHDPQRVRRWLGYATVSTLTGHGRARLLSRLARYRRAADR